MVESPDLFNFTMEEKVNTKFILNKKISKPLSCLATYSPSVAKILDGEIDIILVGDSVGSTLYDMKNSRGVTLDMMRNHGLAVNKNIKKSITMLDMPYRTYRNQTQAFKNSLYLLKNTKAQLLKLEIDEKNIHILKYLCEKNLKIVAHIGVTPQSFNDFKKIKVVGKNSIEKNKLISLALKAQSVGAEAILLECVSQNVAKEITYKLNIPTIGIGSSKYCDGQILVFDDIVKFDNTKNNPKFVKRYLNLEKLIKKAVKNFSKDVRDKKYPNKKYSYQ